MFKSQAPSPKERSKLQIPNKVNLQNLRGVCSELGGISADARAVWHWDLGILWDLEPWDLKLLILILILVPVFSEAAAIPGHT
jgi:hypothetical protein